MNHISTIKKSLIAFLFCVIVLNGFSEIPEGYYNGTENKTEAELKTALHNIIREHTYLTYDVPNISQVWWVGNSDSYGYFRQTDWHPEGYFWDMYSNDKYATYSGSRQNREHCMPRSWWGTSSNYASFDANGDLHNLYPSNAEANSAKSNYPLGEVGNDISYNNGVVKVGRSGVSGYTGIVFEPADEYKGDFARTYLYMITCYEDYVNNWRSLGTSSMLTRTYYPTLTNYGKELLLKWHIQDPVSQKEIDRNEAVYRLQNNRNPFIDHPNFAQLIWGDIDLGIDFQMYVYPNPANEYILLSFTDIYTDIGEVRYSIYSVNGILMQENELLLDNRINLNKFENGLYILVVYVNGKRLTQKFIVNKSLE